MGDPCPPFVQVKDNASPVEQIFKTVVQAREDLGVLRDNTEVTPLMRIYEVVDFKKQMEASENKKLSRSSLASLYDTVKYAKRTEPVKAAYIEVAMMLHRSCLSFPSVRNILQAMEQLAVCPLDSVYKIREVCVQCDKKESLQQWTFTMLMDWWQRMDGCDSVPIRTLKEGPDQVSLVRLFLFKRTLRDHLMREMDVKFAAWTEAIRAEIRRLASCMETFRSELGFIDDRVDGGYKQRGSWPSSADNFLLLLENLIYGYRFDGILKQNIKSRRSAEDTLNHAEIRPPGSVLRSSE